MDGQGVTPPALPTLFQLVSLGGGGGCGLWLGVLSLLSGGDYYPETWCDRGGGQGHRPQGQPSPRGQCREVAREEGSQAPGLQAWGRWAPQSG